MLGGQPIILLKEGTERNRGKGATHNNIAAAKAIADAVRSTLGPKGMDKMLVDSMGDVVITNDGVTILKEIDVEHPAAKMVVEVAKTQDDECGDGTTTAVIIAGELLKRSEDLIDQNVHPTVIAEGFKMAADYSAKILDGLAVEVKPDDDEAIRMIARTAMTGKSVSGQKDFLADLAVKAIRAITEEVGGRLVVDIDNVKVEKKHGATVAQTEYIEGVVMDKEKLHPRMPDFLDDAKVALIDSAIEIKKTEIDAKIQIKDPEQIQQFLAEEERAIKSKVDKILASGANAVFCQKGIDDLAQHFFAKAGIYAVRRVKKSDIEKLSRATGATIVTNLDDLSAESLGKAGRVEERKVGNSTMTFVTGCDNPRAVSVLLRGGTDHVVDEVERAFHDALKVAAVAVEDGKMVPGGGAPEIELALRLAEYATTVGGREQLAIEAFAQALEIVPWTLAENAGLDAIDMLIKLKAAHEGETKNKNAGIDVNDGTVKDFLVHNVVEPLRVKTQAIQSAQEVATMVLRIDDVIAAKKSSGPPPGAGGPPGMGGMGGMPGMM